MQRLAYFSSGKFSSRQSPASAGCQVSYSPEPQSRAARETPGQDTDGTPHMESGIDRVGREEPSRKIFEAFAGRKRMQAMSISSRRWGDPIRPRGESGLAFLLLDANRDAEMTGFSLPLTCGRFIQSVQSMH